MRSPTLLSIHDVGGLGDLVGISRGRATGHSSLRDRTLGTGGSGAVMSSCHAPEQVGRRWTQCSRNRHALLPPTSRLEVSPSEVGSSVRRMRLTDHSSVVLPRR